jgi:hypothetical protein
MRSISSIRNSQFLPAGRQVQSAIDRVGDTNDWSNLKPILKKNGLFVFWGLQSDMNDMLYVEKTSGSG